MNTRNAPRQALIDLCRALGFDPNRVDHIDARPDAIDVTVVQVSGDIVERVTHHLGVEG